MRSRNDWLALARPHPVQLYDTTHTVQLWLTENLLGPIHVRLILRPLVGQHRPERNLVVDIRLFLKVTAVNLLLPFGLSFRLCLLFGSRLIRTAYVLRFTNRWLGLADCAALDAFLSEESSTVNGNLPRLDLAL